MINQDLKGKRVAGIFSEKPYTGVVTESILEKDGFYNHIIQLDEALVFKYNISTWNKRQNRWVYKNINHKVTDSEQIFFVFTEDR